MQPSLIEINAVKRKIEDVFLHLLELVASDAPPSLQLLTNSSGTKLTLNGRNCRRFVCAIKVLSEVYILLSTGQFATKRDLYYQCKLFYGDQSTIDRSITFLCQLLEEPRLNLHILSTAKGRVVGDLRYEEWDGTVVDCQKPVMISCQSEWIRQIRSRATFILVVEKDAIFQKLLDESFCQRFGPCIVITGKGYPDIGTRTLLKNLKFSLHIPVYALMDADPHAFTIRYGQNNLSVTNYPYYYSSVRDCVLQVFYSLDPIRTCIHHC